jgi:cytochrome c peroxidase
MRTVPSRARAALLLAVALGCGGNSTSASSVSAPNASGVGLTIHADGRAVVDETNPFFQSLGTNGRSCATCHVPEAAMTITPEVTQRRFEESGGTDPIFRPNDGSTSPLADVSTVDARRAAYSLLLDRALIRVGMPIPDGAEFTLVGVTQNDYDAFASAKELSLFRRPLPAANLKFLSAVMWDGRETLKCDGAAVPCASANGQPTGFATLHFDLSDQSNAATLGHAQGKDPGLTDEQREAIVAHESALFTAQMEDAGAGLLSAEGGQGGPFALAFQPFHFGVNDTFGGFGETFSPLAMTLFGAWENAPSERRAAIARGEKLFDTRQFHVTDVGGINDVVGPDFFPATCTTCHDTPNAGDHSVPAPLRIGTADAQPAGGLDVAGLPVYELHHNGGPPEDVLFTTDPGRALLTGKWADVGKFKGPTLRGLAARPPYFHNGSAATLDDVVRFYNERFHIGLTPEEQADLAAFLSAL